MICLEKVFIHCLENFVHHFSRYTSTTTRKWISSWICKNFKWENKFFLSYNGVSFFNIANKSTLSTYIYVCMYESSVYYYLKTRSWKYNKMDQTRALKVLLKGKHLLINCKLPKNPNDSSINIFTIEIIPLLFQTYSPS